LRGVRHIALLTSPFAWLHVRLSAFRYLGLRGLAVFVYGVARVPSREWGSVGALVTFAGVAAALGELELRRTGTATLYDNLGVGVAPRSLLAVAPALVGELALMALLRVYA